MAGTHRTRWDKFVWRKERVDKETQTKGEKEYQRRAKLRYGEVKMSKWNDLRCTEGWNCVETAERDKVEQLVLSSAGEKKKHTHVPECNGLEQMRRQKTLRRMEVKKQDWSPSRATQEHHLCLAQGDILRDPRGSGGLDFLIKHSAFLPGLHRKVWLSQTRDKLCVKSGNLLDAFKCLSTTFWPRPRSMCESSYMRGLQYHLDVIYADDNVTLVFSVYPFLLSS